MGSRILAVFQKSKGEWGSLWGGRAGGRGEQHSKRRERIKEENNWDEEIQANESLQFFNAKIAAKKRRTSSKEPQRSVSKDELTDESRKCFNLNCCHLNCVDFRIKESLGIKYTQQNQSNRAAGIGFQAAAKNMHTNACIIGWLFFWMHWKAGR